MPPIRLTASIAAPPATVWRLLTDPAQMVRWLGEPEMGIEVATDWAVGGPIRVSGFHHVRFVNKGIVLAFEPERLLRYSHLSSVSRLPDVPESYTILEFALTPADGGALLAVSLDGFPTESIFKHFELYWRVTLGILKDLAEAPCPNS